MGLNSISIVLVWVVTGIATIGFLYQENKKQTKKIRQAGKKIENREF